MKTTLTTILVIAACLLACRLSFTTGRARGHAESNAQFAAAARIAETQARAIERIAAAERATDRAGLRPSKSVELFPFSQLDTGKSIAEARKNGSAEKP